MPTSHRGSDPSSSEETPSSQETLRQAFEESAAGMELELEAPRPRRRSIGVAVVGVRGTPTVEVPCPEPAPPLEKDDREKIEEIVHAWEEATAQTFIETWKKYGTHPLMVVGHDWIGPVTEDDVRRALESPETRESLEKFPCFEPRRIKVRRLKIVFQGPTKAIATFSAKEKYKNGKVFAGNSAMIFMKNRDGEWKVALFAKHIRGQDFLEKAEVD